MAQDNDGGERMSARAKRKAKEKANARKRAAAGNVVNPYAVLEAEEEEGDEGAPEEATGSNDGRPRTSHSDASGDTLVGAHDSHTTTANNIRQNTDTATADTTHEEPSKFTPRDWSYDPLPSNKPPGEEDNDAEDPDEPLTEAEIRHAEIKNWLLEQKGHAWCLKKMTLGKIADFVYEAKYGEDKAEWTRELRLMVWRAAVRASFWWVNPDTNEPVGKPAPITAPSGMYEGNFPLFLHCAAERLDRIGRDLPPPEHVAQIEAQLRLFFRRVQGKPATLMRPLQHLAFLLLVDEDQNRVVGKEGLGQRLRMCFDGVREMEWKGLGVVQMGGWPVRKVEHPLRTEEVWREVVKRFGL